MLDVINNEQELGALDDLSTQMNSTEDIPTLINIVSRYDKEFCEIRTKKHKEDSKGSAEVFSPEELLGGIKRDMRNGSER